MKIAYTCDGVIKCGGMRVAFEHCRELQRHGHETHIYGNFVDDGAKDWIERYKVNFRPLTALKEGVDVLISIWWPMLEDLLQYPAKKRFHLVQGQDWRSYPTGHDWIPKNEKAMHRTDYSYLAVSKWAGKSCYYPHIIPNGVDTDFFTPAKFIPLHSKFRILFEASTADSFKGTKEAMQIMRGVKLKYGNKIEVWVIAKCGNAEFDDPVVDQQFIDPNDITIVNKYQNADVLLKTTHFDGFGLPHLEAMACGLPLVTTNAGGNAEFCVHKKNCLMTAPDTVDINTLQKYVELIYTDPLLKKRLIKGGLKTASEYSWKNSIDKLEKLF